MLILIGKQVKMGKGKLIKELKLALKLASACNKNFVHWGVESLFQKKIDKLLKKNL